MLYGSTLQSHGYSSSNKSQQSMRWKFDDPLYQKKLRLMKRSSYSNKVVGLIMYPEPQHLIVLMCFLATLTAYVERTGFSIAYTIMAKEAGTVDEGTKGVVMSAFYWGYGISQIPGGIAAQRYGGIRVLTACFMMWSVASLLTPGDASSTFWLKIARCIVGISQGFLIPSVHTIVSSWVPAEERAKSVSLITSGMYLGSASAMELLPKVSHRYGARAILRAVGMLGLCWLFLFRLVIRRVGTTPDQSLPVSSSGKQQKRYQQHMSRSTPWKAIACHPAVWSIVINNFTFHYAFYIVMNWLPTYFDKVLHESIESVGFAKTLPYVMMFVMSNVGGWAGDYLIEKRGTSIATGRKTVNTVGFACAAVALCMMPGAKGVPRGLLYTTMALAAAGFARGGFSVNHMDIAPAYAGIVMGISNTAGTLSGVVGVAVTGYILSWNDGGTSPQGWYMGFSLAAGLCLAGSFIFIKHAQGKRIFGSDTI